MSTFARIGSCAVILLATSVCCAVCITTDDISSRTNAFVSTNGKTFIAPDADGVQQGALFLRGLVNQILTSTPDELNGPDPTKGIARDQITAMTNRSDVWQSYQVNPATPTDPSTVLNKVQAWANKGELVIATWTPPDTSKPALVALVLPGNTDPAGDPKKLLVAYAGPPFDTGHNNNNFVSAGSGAPLPSAFPGVDTTKLIFYRYRL
jgi:hypothetical protein